MRLVAAVAVVAVVLFVPGGLLAQEKRASKQELAMGYEAYLKKCVEFNLENIDRINRETRYKRLEKLRYTDIVRNSPKFVHPKTLIRKVGDVGMLPKKTKRYVKKMVGQDAALVALEIGDDFGFYYVTKLQSAAKTTSVANRYVANRYTGKRGHKRSTYPYLRRDVEKVVLIQCVWQVVGEKKGVDGQVVPVLEPMIDLRNDLRARLNQTAKRILPEVTPVPAKPTEVLKVEIGV